MNEVFPLFENLLNSKASRLVKERDTFQAGITKLDEANEIIDKLKIPTPLDPKAGEPESTEPRLHRPSEIKAYLDKYELKLGKIR